MKLSARALAAEVRDGEPEGWPKGSHEIFDEHVGIFAMLEPISRDEWVLRRRRGALLDWESSTVHASKKLALDEALCYLDTLPVTYTPEHNAIVAEAQGKLRPTSEGAFPPISSATDSRYEGPSSAELFNSGDQWSEQRFLKLSKERGKDSWLVVWRRTGTQFGRIWKQRLDWAGGNEHWQCERTLGEGCRDAYNSKQEALLHLKALNLEAARANERAMRAE